MTKSTYGGHSILSLYLEEDGVVYIKMQTCVNWEEWAHINANVRLYFFNWAPSP